MLAAFWPDSHGSLGCQNGKLVSWLFRVLLYEQDHGRWAEKLYHRLPCSTSCTEASKEGNVVPLSAYTNSSASKGWNRRTKVFVLFGATSQSSGSTKNGHGIFDGIGVHCSTTARVPAVRLVTAVPTDGGCAVHISLKSKSQEA